MKIKNIEKFLSGESFDEGLIIKLPLDQEKITRIEKIISLIKGKRVIHVGCVDHLKLVEKKIKENQWLHKLITEQSSECIGVDINKEGVEFVNKKLNFKNVFYCDLINPNLEKLQKEKWDYLVLGEILEHVDNPNAFLKQIHSLYKDSVSKIIITVPNATCYYNFANIKSGIEMINSDHRSTFTPYLLSKMLYLSGFETEDIYYVDPIYKIHHKIINRIFKKKLISLNQGLSHGLIAVAKF